MSVTLWKCQNCGLTFDRITKGEPRRCPMCLDTGAKDFRGLKGVVIVRKTKVYSSMERRYLTKVNWVCPTCKDPQWDTYGYIQGVGSFSCKYCGNKITAERRVKGRYSDGTT